MSSYIVYYYDNLNRLVEDDVPAAPFVEYGYDKNGNRTTNSFDTVLSNYTYLPNTNVLESTPQGAVVHDAAGNTTSDQGGTRTFEYNNAGRLFKVFESGTLVATYIYNSQGQRKQKITSQGTTVYHYDLNGNVISETSASGQPQVDYIYNGNIPVAQIKINGTTDSLTYIHTDHLGTPRRATDVNGAVVWNWENNAFGETTANSDVDGDGQSTIINLRFAGQYFDQETGLHYNYFRYYDPSTGRYITSDPIGLAGGLNTYGYVGGNPTNRLDPLGLFSPAAHDSILHDTFLNPLSNSPMLGVLSASDVKRLMQSSRNFDKRTQSTAQSFMHSMRQNGLSIETAIRLRDNFVDETLTKACEAAINGDRNTALDLLGEAMHPIMDSSSPAHTDANGNPILWNPLWPFAHSPTDWMGSETAYDLTPQILNEQHRLLGDAYNRVFGN